MKMKPGWRIKLSGQKKSLVVNAATSERARELALAWARDQGNDPDAVVISCKIMADDEFYVMEGDRWMPK